MSRGMKIFWGVIGGLFAVGVILTTLGFALGATGNVWFNREGLHFGSRAQKETSLSDLNTEAFEAIDIELVSVDIKVLVAKSYGYELDYYGTQEPIITVANGKLKIIEDPDNGGFGLMSLWNRGSQKAKLTIYVPSEAELDTVHLVSVSGDTSFEGDQINMGTLDAKSASGNISLQKVSAENLALELASGEVYLDVVSAKTANIQVLSGNLVCDETTLESLTMDITSGNARFKGRVTAHLNLTLLSGNANFELIGSKDDYRFNFNRTSGDIRVNGQTVSDSFLPDSAESSDDPSGALGLINIETTSGSVNIDFR